MAVKNTIAIIASTNERAAVVVNNLSPENYRVLLISKYENQFIPLQNKMQSEYPGIEVDVMDCMKDGCWEADIIILNISYDDEKEVAVLIKEVATQKLIVRFSEDKDDNSNLQELLKYSKVVTAFNKKGSSEISITGKDEQALLSVSCLLKKVGKYN